MANPALNEKRFEHLREEDPGWAAPATAAGLDAVHDGRMRRGRARCRRVTTHAGAMTANGTFAKTFALFVLVLVGGAIGWSQTPVSPTGQLEIPGWAWIAMFGAFAVAMVCVFKPKASPFLAPIYAIGEGLFLGVISKAFESRWDGIVLQAILVTIGVFFLTLALYVFDIVKVTRKFQMVVIAATGGIFVMYLFGLVMSLFGVDVDVLERAERARHRREHRHRGGRRAQPVPRLRVHPPGLDGRRAEVHGVVRRVRDHGHARVAVPRGAPRAVAAAKLTSSTARSRDHGPTNLGGAPR